MAGVIEKRKQLYDEMSRFEAEILGPSNSGELSNSPTSSETVDVVDRPIIGANTFNKVQRQIQDLKEDMPPSPHDRLDNVPPELSNKIPSNINSNYHFPITNHNPGQSINCHKQDQKGYMAPGASGHVSHGPQQSLRHCSQDKLHDYSGPSEKPNQFRPNFFSGPRPFEQQRPSYRPGMNSNMHPNNCTFPPGSCPPRSLPPPPPPPGFMDGPRANSNNSFRSMDDLQPPPPPPSGFIPPQLIRGNIMNGGSPNLPPIRSNQCNPRMGMQPPAFLRPPPPPPGLIPPRVAALNRYIGPMNLNRMRGPNPSVGVVSSGPVLTKTTPIISSQPKLYTNPAKIKEDMEEKKTALASVPTVTETITFPSSESKKKKQKLESKLIKKQEKAEKLQQGQNAALEMAEKVKASTTTVKHHSNNSSNKNLHEEKKGRKSKKNLRYAGGQIWEDTNLLEWDPDDFRLFAGDLGNDVTDELLNRIFSQYPHFVKAKVVRDKRTNKSKGYGFVSFNDPGDYIRAMKEINGKYVGSRPIKLRKSCWKERNLDVVSKKQKEKQLQGLK